MDDPNDNNVASLYRQAFHLSELAVKEDNKGNKELARNSYLEVIRIFETILRLETEKKQKNLVWAKGQEYYIRVQQLDAELKTNLGINSLDSITRPNKNVTAGLPLSPLESILNKAQSTLDRAISQDQQKNDQEALDLYIEAVELFIKARNETQDESFKSGLNIKIKQLLERAEDLKGLPAKPRQTLPVQSASPRKLPTFPSSHSKLTTKEIEVLKNSSYINDKLFLPWLEIDLQEKFEYDEPFIDPDGTLPLSNYQKVNFDSWKRPSEFMDNPKMIAMISSETIRQEVVTDCTFVSSLCVCAAYERRFKKQLITECIYPKNEYGYPTYNPSGKYMVKLTCNGIARKVVVDDLLPISRDGTLMCAFSSNKNELWPSIIEKAYLKLMGGYDFPGSNSSIDLHALTGWIPERILIDDEKFDKDVTWKRLLDGQEYGDVLITISTGDTNESESNAIGLFPLHAYAVLDVQEVNGLRLLRAKNPWSHMRWTGPFSHLDESSWTPELIRKLKYDREKAILEDDGIFWIDFDSVCKNFNSINMNWNPELFPHSYILHSSWPLNPSANMDNLNLAYKPQYRLEVKNDDSKPSAVRLLLSRHIAFTEENKDFITLYVYDETNGERVYCFGKPWKMGSFVDSPHVLIRFNAPLGRSVYTVVVDQHEKKKSLEFSLKSYCMSPVAMSEIPSKYPIEFQTSGKWIKLTAGGNSGYVSYLNNPQYCLSLPTSTNLSSGKARVLLMLEGPRTFKINVTLVWSKGKRVTSVTPKDIVVRSCGYQYGFCYCEIEDIRLGDYTIVVSTFEPDKLGDYKLTVASNIEFKMTPIPLEGAGLFKKTIQGRWISGLNAMGCINNPEYKHNPSYHLEIKEMTTIKIRLQTPKIKPLPMVNIGIFEKHPTKLLGREVGSSGVYTNYPQGVLMDDVLLQPHHDGYIVVFSTWEKDISGEFDAYLYSDRNIVPVENNL